MKISVIGAGSWGTAVSRLLAKKGFNVCLWAREKEIADSINSTHHNNHYLSDIVLPANLVSANVLKEALAGAQVVVLAVPSQFMRAAVKEISPILNNAVPVLSLAKGIELGTSSRMSQVIKEELPEGFENKIAVLSGPNHAEEVSKEIPSATVISAIDSKVAVKLQEIFMTPYFRVYTNNDLVGVEIAAAVKNVIAIASGMSDGLGFGDNTKASLMTRGLAEMTRLGVYFGASALTFSGLSGVGDLIATCTSKHSRNRSLGERFVKGKSLETIAKETKMVAEGAKTCLALRDISRKAQIDMPINDAVVQVLHEDKDPLEVVRSLMGRHPTEENH
ncbi:MAG: NAD(P)H-dependent glycerol-3-phosphate dehydrogenase [Actinobacteria bacterium]|nr:MAG: NAD(P)H-dependent glycerol-3-phosphate dehydrogenase [Actinomycetota bacterium]